MLQDEEMSDAVMEGKIAEIVYRRAVEMFPGTVLNNMRTKLLRGKKLGPETESGFFFFTDDVEFWLSFAGVCELFPFAKRIEEEIYQR